MDDDDPWMLSEIPFPTSAPLLSILRFDRFRYLYPARLTYTVLTLGSGL